MATQFSEQLESKEMILVADDRAFFELAVQRLLGMTSDEFFRRWDEADFRNTQNSPESRNILRIASLMPFGLPDA